MRWTATIVLASRQAALEARALLSSEIGGGKSKKRIRKEIFRP